MKNFINTPTKLGTALMLGGFCLVAASPALSTVRLNLRPRSSLEKPMAVKVGIMTIALRGTIELPIAYSIETQDDVVFEPEADLEISADITLDNRWNLGATYFVQYKDDPFDDGSIGDDENFTDHVAVYLNGSWGTLLAGNVAPLVHERTRRQRNAGNIELAFDNTYGQLDEWSGGYLGRFGPTTVSALIDGDANYDIGISFQRPLGNKDYRFSARHTSGEYLAADGVTQFDTKSANLVAELVYGASRFDIGGGYERLSSDIVDVDRWYTSAGMYSKYGLWSFTTEAHYGQTDGQDEISAAIGLRRDFARGLSAHVGVKYEDAQINLAGVNFINRKDTQVLASIRYGF
ncbi:MAG: hypothetical protein COA43_08425 [Robiginitomaculum sp.]|nr:MAG: hypothetical protein COA43_08425 [Robiginitomaculum sp.]